MKTNKISQDYRKLNDFIRGELRRQHISQSSLAYTLNLSQVGISKRLSGKTDWTMWEILNVFEVLGVAFDYTERTRNED